MLLDGVESSLVPEGGNRGGDVRRNWFTVAGADAVGGHVAADVADVVDRLALDPGGVVLGVAGPAEVPNAQGRPALVPTKANVW